MKISLYVRGKKAYEKEVKAESEWKIDPVFIEGIGDDSKLIASIKEYLEGIKSPKPKPPLIRIGCNGNSCPLCGSGMKPNWLWFKSKGCYQPECENYWRKPN